MPDYLHYCGYCQRLSSLLKKSILMVVSHESPLKIINNSFFFIVISGMVQDLLGVFRSNGSLSLLLSNTYANDIIFYHWS